MSFSYTIFPIGSNALTIDFGAHINKQLNDRVMSLLCYLNEHPVEGILDCITAYSSLTVVYDPVKVRQSANVNSSVFEWLKGKLTNMLSQVDNIADMVSRQINLPVCYDLSVAPDLEYVASVHQLSIAELITIHYSKIYRVYMIGFLPGFAYMASVDREIATPRKNQPRKVVPAGAVGIAGEQTGVYPLSSPGGWQLIGQTPLRLFYPEKKEPAFFQPGDEVQFYPISLKEFNKLKKDV